ncbi:MAG TPA: hypothetical protein IAB09_02715 [Candidatus Avilachnospira avicola]|nr:hypothetical protein [Candidatus Avilachnospira avicola]
MNISRRSRIIIAAAALFLAALSGCSGKKASEQTSEETVSVSAGDSAAALAEAEADTDTDTAGIAGTEGEPSSASLEGETYPETVAADGINEDGSGFFGIMHAVLSGVVQEKDGMTVYTFQDKLDPDNSWAIPGIELGDVLVDPEKGTETAILFQGDIINDADSVDFIAMLPEGEYEIKRAEGVTMHNSMSTFSLRDASGAEIIFLKDNCNVEEGSLENDSGDSIIVYYAESSADGSCYPFRIYAGK